MADYDATNTFKSADRTRFGEIVPRITGSLSALSSLLIIILVARSATKLRSSYHRIMVSMSLTDIMSSTAVVFTHLPMPRPGLSQATDNYEYDGLRLGNTLTCTIQGFTYASGFLGTYGYNTALCIYFSCAIFFKMKKKTISYFVEPLLHILVLVSVLSITLPALFRENFNAVDGWCSLVSLPAKCTSNEDCERGSPISQEGPQYLAVILSMAGTSFCLIVLSLASVCYTTCRDKLIINSNETNENESFDQERDLVSLGEEDGSHERRQARSAEHKASNNFILFQSFTYIGAFLLTVIFPILILSSDYILNGTDFQAHREVLKKLQLIFQPLQGFFNFCIFLSSKIYQQRRKDPNHTIITAMKKIFSKDYEDPILISRISLIEHLDVVQIHYSEWGHEEEAIDDPVVEEDISYPSTQTDSVDENDISYSLPSAISALSGYYVHSSSPINSFDGSRDDSKEDTPTSSPKAKKTMMQKNEEQSSSSFSPALSQISLFSQGRSTNNDNNASNADRNLSAEIFDEGDVNNGTTNALGMITIIKRRGNWWKDSPTPLCTPTQLVGEEK